MSLISDLRFYSFSLALAFGAPAVTACASTADGTPTRIGAPDGQGIGASGATAGATAPAPDATAVGTTAGGAPPAATPATGGAAGAPALPLGGGGAFSGAGGMAEPPATGGGGQPPEDHRPKVVVVPGQGLKGEYFKWSGAPELTPPVLLTQIDPNLDFNGRPGSWETIGPTLMIGHDYFSVRWTGHLRPKVTDKYKLGTRTDDGVRLWLNGVQYIDDWGLHDGSNNDFELELTAGTVYDIRVEYFQKEGGATMELNWSRRGDPANPNRIPPEFFSPP